MQPTPQEATPQPQPQPLTYDPRGGALALLTSRDRELLLDGPAGTGKTFAALWKLHLAALKYPGMHGLLLRKTLVSLKASTLVTFRERILGPNSPVRYWSARADESAHYAYPADPVTGQVSKIYVGGMDKAAKVMSTEYDMILWDEATDGELSEWEALQTRLRYGRMPYQQAIACVNPQSPTHWLNQRANTGAITRLLSRHEDNPTVTPAYLALLQDLTGVRRMRLYLGVWAAAEGMVYQDAWDAARNLVDRASVETRNERTGRLELPRSWPRFLSIDFGFNHPFVCQWWARDPDGRLYLYREIYMTNRLIQTHAQSILTAAGWSVVNGRLSGGRADSDPLPYQVIADPEDAEGRAQLERYLGQAITPAHKEVKQGIQAVAMRMRMAGDGKPRLMLLRDSLVERDPLLEERRAPTCTAEEVESYVWRRGSDGQPMDEPVKHQDDGLDAARYLVAALDLHPSGVEYGPNIWG